MTSDLLALRLQAISERIRTNREAAGMTLLQLAERSDVAPSTIQKIEGRQMTPSIAVLLKIASGLSIEATDLIAAGAASPLEMIIQRDGQHAQIVFSDEMQTKKLSAEIEGSDIECWRVELAPGYRSVLDHPQALTEQIVLCEIGTVMLDFGDQTFELKVGDSLHCRRKHLHAFGNPGLVPAAYVITGIYPHSVQSQFEGGQQAKRG